jgi:hypothetical protein
VVCLKGILGVSEVRTSRGFYVSFTFASQHPLSDDPPSKLPRWRFTRFVFQVDSVIHRSLIHQKALIALFDLYIPWTQEHDRENKPDSSFGWDQ